MFSGFWNTNVVKCTQQRWKWAVQNGEAHLSIYLKMNTQKMQKTLVQQNPRWYFIYEYECILIHQCTNVVSEQSVQIFRWALLLYTCPRKSYLYTWSWKYCGPNLWLSKKNSSRIVARRTVTLRNTSVVNGVLKGCRWLVDPWRLPMT